MTIISISTSITPSPFVSIPHRFNSHPGVIFLRLTINKFQSLTGSIHTIWCCIVMISIYFVSIPHRFNSHIGNRNSLSFSNVFQSLTGSIHTWVNQNLLQICYRFNPSQVQFTPIYRHLLEHAETMFQSLTGSIHTWLRPWILWGRG